MAVLALGIAACGGDDDAGTSSGGGSSAKTTKIKVASIPITSNAVIQLASDKGWFKEEGLEVETVTVPNPPAVVAALQGGQAQVGYAPAIPIVNATSAGLSLKIIAPADGTNPEAEEKIAAGASERDYDDTAVMVRSDGGISSPKELEGKTVAVPARKAQMEVTIANAVADDGGDPTRIRWIALGFPEMNAALQAKRVDAIGQVTPFSGQAEKKGAKTIAYPALALFPSGDVGMWFGTSKYVEGNANAAERFGRVIKKANAYANENLDEVLQVASKTTQTPMDVLQDAARPYWPTEATVDNLQRSADALVELGYIESAPDVEALLP